jgi:homoserine acetyltransferase
MTELEGLTKQSDALVEEYYAGSWSPERLLELRRELAVMLYRTTGHVEKVFGDALMTNLRRKRSIAEHIINARSQDAKTPISFLEEQALTLPTVIDAQTKEVWSDAARDAVKLKIDATKQVLSAMQQEIADLAHEKRTTHFQGT